jgi:hypothetical protein
MERNYANEMGVGGQRRVDTASYSEMLVAIYQTMWCRIPEDSIISKL